MSSSLRETAGKESPSGVFRLPLLSGLFNRVSAVLLRRLMEGLEAGSIRFILPDGGEIRCVGNVDGPDAVMQFRTYAGIFRLITGGYMGLGEGYLAGHWSTPSLKTLFAFGTTNQEPLKIKLAGTFAARVFRKISRILSRNSRSGSRRNISYHYDLGNAFYERWLDPSMTYSSALYTSDGLTLQKAQEEKYRRIVEQLYIQPHHTVLEIGCGWGGFAEFAARETGASVTAITISREQHEYAVARIKAAGLSDRVDVRLVDYRDVTGEFDRIVSIEMLEAVGEAYWPVWFNSVSDRLTPDGKAMVQVITVPDHRFDTYRRKSDFIQRHIFPGGMLLSPGEMSAQTAAAGLKIEDSFWFGESYARTLDLWYRRFTENWPDIRPLGFDDRFRRLWEYYLNYTAAGFRAGTINLGQFLLTKKS